ncbi:hypothetical protein SUNI508_01927 [Seiridium unicorne]|uniref:Uncharacterized protein n=1 Tax=Seiridium unicorne TaxID=138068 RepID=A0ABR2UL26_9PEZI
MRMDFRPKNPVRADSVAEKLGMKRAQPAACVIISPLAAPESLHSAKHASKTIHRTSGHMTEKAETASKSTVRQPTTITAVEQSDGKRSVPGYLNWASRFENAQITIPFAMR